MNELILPIQSKDCSAFLGQPQRRQYTVYLSCIAAIGAKPPERRDCRFFDNSNDGLNSFRIALSKRQNLTMIHGLPV